MHPHPGQAPFVQQVRTLYLKHLGAAKPNVSQAFNFFCCWPFLRRPLAQDLHYTKTIPFFTLSANFKLTYPSPHL